MDVVALESLDGSGDVFTNLLPHAADSTPQLTLEQLDLGLVLSVLAKQKGNLVVQGRTLVERGIASRKASHLGDCGARLGVDLRAAQMQLP